MSKRRQPGEIVVRIPGSGFLGSADPGQSFKCQKCRITMRKQCFVCYVTTSNVESGLI